MKIAIGRSLDPAKGSQPQPTVRSKVFIVRSILMNGTKPYRPSSTWKTWLANEFGGAKRDRTADLLHAMQALSQLSYSPIKVVRLMAGPGILVRHVPCGVAAYYFRFPEIASLKKCGPENFFLAGPKCGLRLRLRRR